MDVRRALVLGGVLVAAAGCGASPDATAAFPTRTAPPTTSAAPVTDPGGGPTVADFTVLPTYECLAGPPLRALVTVGWTAPSATGVTISLDGRELPSGIQDQLPHQVPAGGAKGIGATVVLPCDETTDHTITVRWTTDGPGTTTRTATTTRKDSSG